MRGRAGVAAKAEAGRGTVGAVGGGSWVRKLLVRNGWSCQMPARRAVQRDDEAVAGWGKEVWPRVEGRCRADLLPAWPPSRARRPDHPSGTPWGRNLGNVRPPRSLGADGAPKWSAQAPLALVNHKPAEQAVSLEGTGAARSRATGLGGTRFDGTHGPGR
ncbi:winged helix-turn-helix domain-containing protein [Streptomyces puniciscabiei]|uniref:winged helix-turn-helix domain-containing protein n=1 Tax=Streptomyces puniciscabiei TaxID=164348 RepID=UPI0037915F92